MLHLRNQSFFGRKGGVPMIPSNYSRPFPEDLRAVQVPADELCAPGGVAPDECFLVEDTDTSGNGKGIWVTESGFTSTRDDALCLNLDMFKKHAKRFNYQKLFHILPPIYENALKNPGAALFLAIEKRSGDHKLSSEVILNDKKLEDSVLKTIAMGDAASVYHLLLEDMIRELGTYYNDRQKSIVLAAMGECLEKRRIILFSDKKTANQKIAVAVTNATRPNDIF